MFDLKDQDREALIKEVSELLETFYEHTDELPISQDWDIKSIRDHIKKT